VTIEGVARALGVRVVRHPALVAALERYYQERLGTAAVLGEPHLKMAEVPEGAELLADGNVRFPTIRMGNVYILPGVPEIFRQKFEAIRDRFRGEPFHLRQVFVSVPESALAPYLNDLVAAFPTLLLGSYPEFSNPEYRVKVTLESRDAPFLEGALSALLAHLPRSAVVRVV
jgi:molybdopterin-biosynthesis enzyme MoeA-like protein